VQYAPNRHLRGARITKQNKHWQPQGMSGDSAIAEGWELLLSRIREMSLNSPIIKRVGDLVTQMVVGSGIQSYSAPQEWFFEDRDGEVLERLDLYAIESDWHFTKWAEKHADAEGRDTWWELQKQFFREFFNTGNGLMLRCRMPLVGGRRIPDAYQILEWEQLDRSLDRPATESQNAIRNGIELDGKSRAVAYHILEAHPYDGYSSVLGSSARSQRIPANRIIHLFDKHRPSAHAGISAHSAVVQDAKDTDTLCGSQVQKSIVSSFLTAIISDLGRTRIRGLSGTENDDEGDLDSQELRLGVANLMTFANKVQVDTIKSDGSTDATAIAKLLLLLQSMGVNVSYPRLTGDCASINFSAGLLAQANDYAFVAPIQQFYGARVLVPVRENSDRWHAMLGHFKSFTPREFARDEEMLTEYLTMGPGMPELKPEEEVDASLAKLRSGQTTLAEENAKRGKYWRRTLRQRRTEERFAERMGLILDFSKGQGSVTDKSTATKSSGDGASAENQHAA
jgi:lambda family phage portal protein